MASYVAHALLHLLALSADGVVSAAPDAQKPGDGSQAIEGNYSALEHMDVRRIMMRVAGAAPLPPADEDIMLDELEQWKWRVEMAAAGAAVLVTSSQCPHGLGLLPTTLTWQGGGRWRRWPGTFEHSSGSLVFVQVPTWKAIHPSRACQGSPGIQPVGREVVGLADVEACQQACAHRAGCTAVDFYAATNWCQLYDKPCTNPQKTHDGASSWSVSVGSQANGGVIEEGFYAFLDAKKRCHELESCKGFSFHGNWPDKDRLTGQPRKVYFSNEHSVQAKQGPQKWHSYVRRDSPRANCNPEGKQFECPANPYACLGLSIDADESAIKQSYRALGKQFHPDKLAKSARTKEAVKEAERVFREISESHEVLRDVGKRRQIDQKLRRARKQWEEQRASVQDLYIKEPQLTSLEPESYPMLIPYAREWLVHFFLPQNDDCKQMKIAMGRAAGELGTGEEERGAPTARPRPRGPHLKQGDVFRGVLREKSVALRTEGAGMAEGDTYIALSVLANDQATLFISGEELSVTTTISSSDGRPLVVLRGNGRTYQGRFDKANPDWLRGTIAEASQPGKDVASFAVRRDTWQPSDRQPGEQASATNTSVRQKPRLYGAVNCGRFPDFCKRKGADPAMTKRFPQVRMLFPDEVRFEIYRGRPLGREVVAFAREASRASGEVRTLDTAELIKLQGAAPTAWLLLLQLDTGGAAGAAASKASLDCALCRSALPALRRASPRLAGAQVQTGWVNCSAEAPACASLLGVGSVESADELKDVLADWGAMRLVELGIGKSTASPGGATPQKQGFLQPTRSFPLWDQQLLVGEPGQAVLVSALSAAASMAEVVFGSKQHGASEPPKTKDEL